jgi:hypothetical protein
LAEETLVPGEKSATCRNYRQTLSHNVVSTTPRPSGIQKYVIGTDCTGSCKIQLQYNPNISSRG